MQTDTEAQQRAPCFSSFLWWRQHSLKSSTNWLITLSVRNHKIRWRNASYHQRRANLQCYVASGIQMINYSPVCTSKHGSITFNLSLYTSLGVGEGSLLLKPNIKFKYTEATGMWKIICCYSLVTQAMWSNNAILSLCKWFWVLITIGNDEI